MDKNTSNVSPDTKVKATKNDDPNFQKMFAYKNIGQEFETENDVLTRKLKEENQTACKNNNVCVKFNEISENLDYAKLLLNDEMDVHDVQEIKLRNKKLENDLIQTSERHLTELSKVRENYENKIKFKTSELQSEIDELRQGKDQVDIENSQKIHELRDVIEAERNAQKKKLQDIVAHYQDILDRTVIISVQMDNDFDTIETKTNSLRNQVATLEIDLKHEFLKNCKFIENELPFATKLGGNKVDKQLERQSDIIIPSSSQSGGAPVEKDRTVCSIHISQKSSFLKRKRLKD